VIIVVERLVTVWLLKGKIPVVRYQLGALRIEIIILPEIRR
jgi:hypothetical protein